MWQPRRNHRRWKGLSWGSKEQAKQGGDMEAEGQLAAVGIRMLAVTGEEGLTRDALLFGASFLGTISST